MCFGEAESLGVNAVSVVSALNKILLKGTTAIFPRNQKAHRFKFSKTKKRFVWQVQRAPMEADSIADKSLILRHPTFSVLQVWTT